MSAEKASFIDNVIDIGPHKVSQWLQDVVNVLLDVGHRVFASYHWYIERFLATMCNHSKYVMVVRVDSSLLEEQGCIKD